MEIFRRYDSGSLCCLFFKDSLRYASCISICLPSQRRDSLTDMVHIAAGHIGRAVGSGYRRVSLAIQRRSLTIHDRDLNKHKARP